MMNEAAPEMFLVIHYFLGVAGGGGAGVGGGKNNTLIYV